MGMCWSGYLSTHVGMMDALNARELTSKAILSHTIGGICAGVSAHFIFMIIPQRNIIIDFTYIQFDIFYKQKRT